MWCGTVRHRHRFQNEPDSTPYEEDYKVIVVGAPCVGKTCKYKYNITRDKQINNID